MVPTQTVEEFRTASRSLLRLFRLGKALTEVEESIIAAKIESLRIEFPDWRKRRVRMLRQFGD